MSNFMGLVGGERVRVLVRDWSSAKDVKFKEVGAKIQRGLVFEDHAVACLDGDKRGARPVVVMAVNLVRIVRGSK